MVDGVTRKHHNQTLIAFQASAFSSIELHYLCAELLQRSSTTWGPQQCWWWERRKPDSFAADECWQKYGWVAEGCFEENPCQARKCQLFHPLSPLSSSVGFGFSSVFLFPVLHQSCCSEHANTMMRRSHWARDRFCLLWKHFNICWRFNFLIKAWTLWRLSFPSN